MLIGARPADGHRRDLLIEHLHLLNDAWRCLHDRQLVALAQDMNIPMAEVYEVATFYHHFQVIKGDATAPGLTVRAFDGLACELVGAQDMRVIAAPCMGHCEQASTAVVHQTPVPLATHASVVSALNSVHVQHPWVAGAINFVVSNRAGKSIADATGCVDRQGR